MENKMKANLPKIEQDKLDKIFEIEDLYETGKLSLEEARKQFSEQVGTIKPYHIALIEQTMTEEDDHECIRVNMTKTLQLLIRDQICPTTTPLCIIIVKTTK